MKSLFCICDLSKTKIHFHESVNLRSILKVQNEISKINLDLFDKYLSPFKLV